MLSKTGISGPSKSILIPVITILMSWMLAGGQAYGGPPSGEPSKSSAVIPEEEGTRPYCMPGELVVKLTVWDTTSIDIINEKFGTRVLEHLYQLRSYLLTTSPGTDSTTTDLEELAKQMRADPLVEAAHPNYLLNPLQPVQGSFPISDLHKTGTYDDQPAAITLGLSDAHAFSTGTGVTVAVLDGGVDYTHPAFSGSVVSGYDYIDDDMDAMDEPGGENSGHGTFVAGVVHLVAPEAQIRAYRVTEISGESHGYLVAEAILQAVADNCQVINLSMVMMEEHGAIKDAIAYARDNNVVVVAAAGNGQYADAVYPASDPNAITVAAVDTLNLLTDFSRFGSHIDVCAPGSDIYSPYQDSLYAWWSGTSFAAPFVSGQAALLISEVFPYYSAASATGAILSWAIALDELNPDFAGMLGEGLIDPVASLADTLQPGFAIVVLNDDSLHFEADSGSTGLLYGSVLLYSTNSPAAYSVSYVGVPQFTTILNDQGFTNDSVVFAVDPSGLMPGLYQDTVCFYVEGTWNTPIDTVISLSIRGLEPDTPWAFVHMDSIDLFCHEGDTTVDTVTGHVCITSDNVPAPYTVSLVGTPSFIDLMTHSGVTNDCVVFTVTCSSLPPGDYCDTLLFEVEGVVNNPVLAPIWFSVFPDVPVDSAWVTPNTLDLYIEEGSATVDTFCFDIFSINAPASYTVEFLDEPSFITLLKDSGVTNDEICFVSDPRGLGPGVYSDTLIFEVDSIIQWIRFFVATVAVRPAGGPPDTASLSPDTLFFTAQEGDDTVLTGHSFLISTNEPADFTAIKDTSASHFLGLIDFSGQTNATVGVTVAPHLVGGPGVYNTFVIYLVDGVDYPVYLSIVVTIEPPSSPDSAWVTPDSLLFTATQGEYILLTGYSYLSSTNAPATYTACLDWSSGDTIPGVDPFISLIDSVGETNDSVGVAVTPGHLSPGTYRRSAIYVVDSIADPAYLKIVVTVQDSSSQPSDTAWVTHGSLDFVLDEGSTNTHSGSFGLYSSNAPAAYTVSMLGEPLFTTLFNTEGTTNDSIYFEVEGDTLVPGIYQDTVEFQVEGVGNSPFGSIITLSIRDTTSGSSDSAWVACNDSLFFVLEEGSFDTLVGCVEVYSTNAPAYFTASLLGIPHFTTLPVDTGVTNSISSSAPTPFCFVVAGSSLAPGGYSDTLLLYVDSVENNPLVVIIALNVVPAGSAVDSAHVSPGTLSFTAPVGSDSLMYGCVYLSSTNAPAGYFGEINGDADTIFIELLDSVGTTNDTVCVSIDPSLFGAGLYCNTVWFYVDSVQAAVPLTVYLNVGGWDSGQVQEPSVAQNFPNPFNPETNITFGLPQASWVELTIHNVLGRKVATLVSEELPAGPHTVSWNGTDGNGNMVSSGVYFYRLSTDSFTGTKKMLLLR